MRVLIITQFYRPEPSVIPTGLARELAAKGHDVVVVTAFPSRPGGVLHEGYTQRFGYQENDSGVRVVRVPTVVSHDRNALRRVASFLSFSAGTLREAGWARGADVVYVYATPMTAAIGPRIWKAVWGTPFVLHIQDLWPESVTQSGMIASSIKVRMIDKSLSVFLRWIYQGASHSIAIAPTMARTLASRGVGESRLSTVLNWTAERYAAKRENKQKPQTLRLVYAGNMGRFQDVQTIVKAASLVQDLSGLRIDLYGDGVDMDALRAQAEGIRNLTFHGRVSRASLGKVYAACDFQLVTLKNLPVFEGTVPSKFQASMASGIPVITTVPGDVRNFVLDNDLGLVAESENARSLAAAIRSAYEMSPEERRAAGDRALEFYRQNMSYGVSGRLIEDTLSSVGKGLSTNRRTRSGSTTRGL